MAGSRLPEQSGTSVEAENEVPSPVRPNIRKKTTKGRNNLRKSLAWNEAFFTDEGVLDVDELQIVAKTPKKPLQLPLIEIPELSRPSSVHGVFTSLPGARSGQHDQLSVEAQKLKVGLLEESEEYFEIYDLKQGDEADPEESLLESDINHVCKQVSTLPSSAESNLLSKDGSEDVRQALLEQACRSASQPVSSLSSVVSAVAKECLDASEMMMQKPVQGTALQKGTRLRLPGSFAKDIHVERDAEALSKLPPLPNKGKLLRSQSAMVLPTASTSLSQRVSSISKKVKSALGKVLPGRSESQKRLKEAPDKSSLKQPLATMSSGPLEASPKLTSAHASSPFSRSGRNIMPESSSMLTRQYSSSAVLNGLDKSSKLTAAHASSPFNRSGRNILPEASGIATRQQARSNVFGGPVDISAKVVSGYASSPFNRSGRNILSEALSTRQQPASLYTNGHAAEASAKVAAASSPFNRSGRNFFPEASGSTGRQHLASSASTRNLDASVKVSSMPSSPFNHSGRNILSDVSKVSSGQQPRSTITAPNVPNQSSAMVNPSYSSSPFHRSGRNMVSENSTVPLRSTASKSSSTSSTGGAKLSSSSVSGTKSGGSKISAAPTAPGATAPAVSRIKSAPQVAPKTKSQPTKSGGNVGIQSKSGLPSKQISSQRNGSGTSAGEKPQINASSCASTASNSKPSGLRLPAPKLGFFESTRINGSSTLPDKSLGAGSNTNNAAAGKGTLPPRGSDQIGRSRLPSAPTGRPGTDSLAAALHARVLSSIPAPPHLRGSGSTSRYKASSVSAPASPKRSTSRTLARVAEQKGYGRSSSPPSRFELRHENGLQGHRNHVPNVFAEDIRPAEAASSLTDDTPETESHRGGDSLSPSGVGHAMPAISSDETRLGGGLDACSADVSLLGPGTLAHRHADVSTSGSVDTEAACLTSGKQWNGGSVLDPAGCLAEAENQDPSTAEMSLADSRCRIEQRISSGGDPCAVSCLMGQDAGASACDELNSSACQPEDNKGDGPRQGGATVGQRPSAAKLLVSCKGAAGLGRLSTGGESLESPSHWVDWQKFKERTPDPQKIQSTKGEGAKSVSPVQLTHQSDSSPTSSSGDGPRLVRCTSSPMVLNGRSPLGPLANPVARRDSRSFFSLARKAVSRLTSSPKVGQENDCGDKQPAALTQKGRRLSKAGQTTQWGLENPAQQGSEDLPEDAGQEGGENQSTAAIPDIRKLSPFTEEWIAALEAAGQEALEMKGGSVQNSPPNKMTSTTSNPWSPVRGRFGL